MSREEQQSADAPSARDVAAAREGGASTAPTERATIGGAVAHRLWSPLSREQSFRRSRLRRRAGAPERDLRQAGEDRPRCAGRHGSCGGPGRRGQEEHGRGAGRELRHLGRHFGDPRRYRGHEQHHRGPRYGQLRAGRAPARGGGAASRALLREDRPAVQGGRSGQGALYIGSAGISDENYRRLVVDWRSPVAEVYYNQTMGPTSYVADGRTIHVDLKLRRQFEI